MNCYDCVIVGAGVGGLYIAHHLKELGNSYLLLESQERIGGRIDTNYFEEHSFELGAARILQSQKRVMRLVKKGNLKIEEQILEDAAVHLQGQWHPSLNSILDKTDYPDPLDLFDELLKEHEIFNLESFETFAPESWDSILTKEWLENQGVPKDYAKLYFLGDIDTELENITLYESMFFYTSNLSDSDSSIYRLSGGMTALTDQLAKKIKNITSNRHVNSVTESSEGYVIKTNEEEVLAKNVIFTCSLNALSQIQLPVLASQKVNYWLTIGHYGKSAKGYFKLASNPFPEDTYLISEVPMRMLRRSEFLWEFYLPSLNTSYNEEKIRAFLITYFGKENLIELHVKSYDVEPYFGCYWNYYSGKFHHIFDASKECELQRGLYSVGEHFSLHPNWIEGTLESADNFLNLYYQR